MEAPADEHEQQGLAAFRDGDLQQAIDHLRQAQHQYQQRSEPVKAAELANSLSVVLLQAGRSEEALQAVEGTVATFAAIGDRQRQAVATGNWAAALEANHQLEPAEAKYREAAELFGKLGDGESQRQTLAALSQLQLKQRRPLEAAATLSASPTDRSLRGRLLKLLFRIQSRLLRP